MPADGLAPNSAKPSAGTVRTTKTHKISWSILSYWRFSVIIIMMAEETLLDSDIQWHLEC